MISIALGLWSISTMWQTHVVSSGVGLVLLILGALQPQMILLDMPFGLAFYVVDRLGIWKPGILWAVDHRLIAIGCWLIWPFLVSLSLGYVLVIVTIRLWRCKEKKRGQACDLRLSLTFDHPEGASFARQFPDGLWYHVVVEFPKETK